MRTRNIIAAAAAAAAALGAVSFGAFAEEEPAGYIYFMADKSTIGQGFTVLPEKVAFYEGETGLDVVKRAADVLTDDAGYGAYITAFADEDILTEIPDEIKAVVPEMTGRNTEGYLSAMDYTPESGWTYFINDEYAQVGIGDYIPADGDVVLFSFTVYGYGADLGVDNSSWGGAAALVPAVKKSELIRLCAESKDADINEYVFNGAMEVLAQYGTSQEDIDNAVTFLSGELNSTAETAPETAEETVDEAADAEPEKGSPSTGVESAAVAFAAVVFAGAGIALSRKK